MHPALSETGYDSSDKSRNEKFAARQYFANFDLRSCSAATLFSRSKMNRDLACVHRLYFVSHRLKIVLEQDSGNPTAEGQATWTS
jgi:hypothetical protein